MIHSVIRVATEFSFKEEDLGLIDDARNIKDTRSRLNKSFTREQDYVIYKFSKVKPKNALAKLLCTSYFTVDARYKELVEGDPKYIEGLIEEFEGDKKET